MGDRMNRAEAIERARQYYRDRKIEIERDVNDRQLRAEREVPGLAALLTERASLPVSSLRLAMARPGEAQQIADNMKSRGMELNRLIREALVSAGFAEDYLKARYECKLCSDTGYIQAGASARPCECFERRVLGYLDGDRTNPLALVRFEDFDESILPEEIVSEGFTQKTIAIDRRRRSEEYADSYPDTACPGLILGGKAGVGKTFLLSCIYRRLLERGVNALAISSFELMERIRRKHFHQEDANDTDFDEAVEVPVLLIDDFGNEPLIKGISSEYLCLLLNERMGSRRHTVITTNLTPTQLSEKYNERISSRLADTRYWEHLYLPGRDLRRA